MADGDKRGWHYIEGINMGGGSVLDNFVTISDISGGNIAGDYCISDPFHYNRISIVMHKTLFHMSLISKYTYKVVYGEIINSIYSRSISVQRTRIISLMIT